MNMRLDDLDDPIPLIPRKRRQPHHRPLRDLARSEVKIEHRVDDKGFFGLGTDDDECKCRGRFVPEAVDQGRVGDRGGLMGLVRLGRGSGRGLCRQSLSCMNEKLLLVKKSSKCYELMTLTRIAYALQGLKDPEGITSLRLAMQSRFADVCRAGRIKIDAAASRVAEDIRKDMLPI